MADSMDIITSLKNDSENILSDVIRWRRKLHMVPELKMDTPTFIIEPLKFAIRKRVRIILRWLD